MHALVYRCPYCAGQVDVTPDMIDQTLICPNPNCQKPFQLEAPKAQLVGSHELEAGSDAAEAIVENTASDDRELRVVHPSMFRKAPFRFLGLLLLSAGGLAAAAWSGMNGRPEWALAGLIVGLGALAVLVGWWIKVLHITLILTTKRTILRTGLFAKRTTEVRHNDVRNLQIDQTFIERMLGVGDLAISSAGQEGLEIIVRGVPNPNQIAEVIRDLQQ